ncbi:AAA family ATPase [Haladaptatus pallidirubidus]|uniref:AAA family ATPase n=1 Tax=Haladaptatus pallidirubidus TaxID=1008152 RepID=UPI0035E62644
MTGTVYAVASGKGGVGKTTTAINLGAMLASAEHEVIVVDTDLGMANVEGYLDFEPTDSTLHEVLAGETTVEDSIYEAPGDIHVLPSSTDIHAFAQSQTAKLQRVVAQLREEYEYVLLTPARASATIRFFRSRSRTASSSSPRRTLPRCATPPKLRNSRPASKEPFAVRFSPTGATTS